MRNDTQNNDALDQAVAAWRRAEPAELSSNARANILREARKAREIKPTWAELFSFRRLAFAAAAPTVTVAALAGLWTLSVPSENSDPDATVVPIVEFSQEIKVSKVDGAIVFEIENGTKVHEVRKSTTPTRFDDRMTVYTEDGAFEDTINDGVALTFYRID